MTTLLFIGDIVGEVGVAAVESRLPSLITQHRPDFIIANAENEIISHTPGAPGNCGMSPELNARLFTAGVDLLTGGNHSWDGPYGRTIHDDLRVLRPLNYGIQAPGRGAKVVQKQGVRLGVINVCSLTALDRMDHPLAAADAQLKAWQGAVDVVLVDFHGESVSEKLTFAYALAGQAATVVGTHTHAPTLDTRILPGGTAYVSDVGMVGPSEGIQGYAAPMFANSMRLRLYSGDPFVLAEGPVEFGAVVITCAGSAATHIERVPLFG